MITVQQIALGIIVVIAIVSYLSFKQQDKQDEARYLYLRKKAREQEIALSEKKFQDFISTVKLPN